MTVGRTRTMQARSALCSSTLWSNRARRRVPLRQTTAPLRAHAAAVAAETGAMLRSAGELA